MSFGPPPPVCKIAIVKASADSAPQEDCQTVSTTTFYVVLSNNPESLVTATLRWPVGNPSHEIQVASTGGDNLILKGEADPQPHPTQVEVFFPNTDLEIHSCEVTHCVPKNCD
jgi:hypothetical protein